MCRSIRDKLWRPWRVTGTRRHCDEGRDKCRCIAWWLEGIGNLNHILATKPWITIYDWYSQWTVEAVAAPAVPSFRSGGLSDDVLNSGTELLHWSKHTFPASTWAGVPGMILIPGTASWLIKLRRCYLLTNIIWIMLLTVWRIWAAGTM